MMKIQDFFHGVINWKRRQLAIKGVMIDSEWVVDMRTLINEFQHLYRSLFQGKMAGSLLPILVFLYLF